jgi:hypothetical protein
MKQQSFEAQFVIYMQENFTLGNEHWWEMKNCQKKRFGFDCSKDRHKSYKLHCSEFIMKCQ